MRVSTSMIYGGGATGIQNRQSDLYRLQNQLSSGRRMLAPADDPIASAQALVTTQNQSVNAQFLDNQANAASLLTELEDRVGGVADLIQSVKQRAVEAGNGAYSDSDRRTIAAEIRQRFDELLGLANASDGMGLHVFSGFKSDVQPFSVSGVVGSRSIAYDGDDGKRQIQVESARMMDVSESGSDVFMRIRQGNGTFAYTAGAANTGTGILGSSSVISGFDGSTYDIQFEPPVAPATTSTTFQLTVTPLTGAPVVSTGLAFVAGQDIVLGAGANQFKVAISGTPVAGDTFKIEPSTNQSIFETLDDMIRVLETASTSSAAGRVSFRNQLTNVSENLDLAYDHILDQQTSIGARRSALDSLTNVGSDFDLQFRTDLSRLQDLDYVDAISQFTNRQIQLEAAQKSFTQISQLNLFKYL